MMVDTSGMGANLYHEEQEMGKVVLTANEAEGHRAVLGLKFCGCGYPHDAYKGLLDALVAHDSGDSTNEDWDERYERREAWEKGIGREASYLIRYFLDAAQLVLHGDSGGGTVGGCWLSDKGKAVVAFLNRCGVDPDEWPESDD